MAIFLWIPSRYPCKVRPLGPHSVTTELSQGSLQWRPMGIRWENHGKVEVNPLGMTNIAIENHHL